MIRRETTIDGFPEYARKVVAEGIVLLKNDDKILPIKGNEVVSVFGRCQIDYYKSGTGSGGSVHVKYSVNAIDGLRNNKRININEALAKRYEEFVAENPFDNGGGGWAAEPWFQEEMALDDEVVLEAGKVSDKAIIIIGRTAGEEQDNRDTEGSYRLTTLEEQMLIVVTKYFKQVTVVLNVANIIDMSWLNDERHINPIKGLIYAWQGGMEGGNALADIISGDVTPSGKLTDTIADCLTSYPTHVNFGHEKKNIYQEDIYLGYRYFETFNRKAVLYPFGFGLSYTTFDIEKVSYEVKGQGLDSRLIIQCKITNTGQEYSGKEIVQIYYEAPQGVLGKPAKQLCAFEKTRLLSPGEVQDLEIIISISQMASYDDGGYTGNKSCYVLEAGEYKIFAGNSVRNTDEWKVDQSKVDQSTVDQSTVFTLDHLVVVEKLQEALAPSNNFTRMKPGVRKENGEYELIYEATPTKTISMEKRIEQYLPKELFHTGDQGIKLKDVKVGKNTMDEFIAQLSAKELSVIVRGEGMSSPKVTAGTAGAFGGVGDRLQYYGIPVACCADGPSGLRMDTGEKATQLPIGTLLACSWNVEMIEKLYIYEGQELVLNEVDTLLGPGMNIHRYPLNGRNFEYFSEDPYLTGRIAIANTSGLRKGGSVGTIKHFAANDQEHERRYIDSIVSERALREIHLKGFEMVVKAGETTSLMTAYNPINGILSASNFDLNTTVLREEWGYKGIVMSDWWALLNDPITGGEGSIKNTSYMVKAQNDIYMVVNNFGAEVNGLGDDLEIALENGTLTLGELQRCGANICSFIMNAPVMDRPIKSREIVRYARKPINIEGKPIFKTDLPIQMETNKDATTYLEVESEGEYSIVVEMKNDGEPSAQSSCNILLNEEYVTNIQLNGTYGRWLKEKNVTIQLEKGSYKLDVAFTKLGLEIGTIAFVAIPN